MRRTLNPGMISFAIAACVASSAPAEPIDFARDVRPIFQRHCYKCHGEVKQKSGLRLDVKALAFKGGDAYGPSIVAGRADESPLMRLVRSDQQDERMPPEGDALAPAEIETLRRWIGAGAAWPDGIDQATLDDPRRHWAFQPVASPQPPATNDPSWPQNDLDRFVLARLEREGLRPAPQAEPVAWLRRVTFDLTGLPPTPDEVAAFLADPQSDSRRRVVDALLQSPRYGERWAQHWLDVVRYADTHGFEVNTERPNAWPYRDYVIASFNADTPYDRFLREQILGAAVGQEAATGFLVTASVLLPGQIGADEPSKRLARQDSLDEIVVNVGQTFLGLSVGCARCHDHKFDPISQLDYYALQALVAGVEYADRDLRTPEADAKRAEAKRLSDALARVERGLAQLAPLAGSGVERAAVNPRANIDRFPPVNAVRLRFTILATNNLEPCVDELEVFNAAGENVALASAGTRATASGQQFAADRHELRFVNDGNYGNSRSWLSNTLGQGWVELQFSGEETIERVVWSRDRDGKFADRMAIDYRIEIADPEGAWRSVADASDRARPTGAKQPAPFSTAGLNEQDTQQAVRLIAEKRSLEAAIAQAKIGQKAFAGQFRKPDAIHRLHRGDPEQPKEAVAPAVLSVLGSTTLAVDAAELARRQTLADWLADPANPLAARVMVNRIWQGHFGTGLVDTPSDFGRSGTRPSHPELLDWLASEFVRSGWSIKHLHRLIVLSATYRQSARHDAQAAAKDAGARLLWRFPPRRLEAEALRDAILAVSGRLNLKTGGPGFNLFEQRGGLAGFTPIDSPEGDGLRRMIYAHKVRRERDAVFGVFDCPDAGQSTARRRESTTPLQALNLFNSRFTIEQSEAFAARVRSEVGADAAAQVRRAYRLALAREPDDDELAEALPAVRAFGLAPLCRALFNSNEFVFLP